MVTAPRTESSYELAIGGTLTAGVGSAFVSPNPANTYTYTLAHLARGESDDLSVPMGASTSFSMAVVWHGGPAVSGTIHSMQYVITDGALTEIFGYGSKSIALSSFVPEDAGAVTMGPVDEAPLAGSLDLPDAWTLASASGFVGLADGARLPLGYVDEGSSFAFQAPAIAGATGMIGVSADDAAGSSGYLVLVRRGFPLPSEDLVVEVPDMPMPTPMAPAEGAGDFGPGTELRVAAVPGAHYFYIIYPDDDSGPTLRVIAFDPSVALPDFTAFGLALPEGETYRWITQAFAGFDSIDDFADAEHLNGIIGGGQEVLATAAPVREVIAR